MKQGTYIISSWEAETKKHVQQQTETLQSRYNAYKEFKESVCDLFDMRDFYYYAELTGCKIENILRLAKYSTDKNYVKYQKPARNKMFRRQFYLENGHSITKQFNF